MEKVKLNYDKLFKEILSSFFTKNEISRFQKLISSKKPAKKTSSLSGLNKNQIELNIGTESNIQNQIDLLITFGSERLSRNKYISLLQHLGQFCITIGKMNSAASIFDIIISKSGSQKSPGELKASAMDSLAEIYRRKGEWDNSFSYAKKALATYKKSNNKKGQGVCLNLIGTIYGELGNFKKAKEYFKRVWKLYPVQGILISLGQFK